MKKVIIVLGLLLGSCSTSQSTVAEATDPDVVSRASYYGACSDKTCDYYAVVHHHAVLR